MTKSKREARRLRQRAIAAVGSVCAHCGTSKKLQFAHTKPTTLSGMARGRKRRYKDVIKNPDSYARLCDSCHWKFDHETPPQADTLAATQDHQSVDEIGW